MKALILISVFLMSATGYAAIKCEDGGEKITIDTRSKQVEIVKEDGHAQTLKMIQGNHHAFGFYGDKAYEIQGGYILGLKQRSAKSPKKDLTVFKNGAPIAQYKDCTL